MCTIYTMYSMLYSKYTLLCVVTWRELKESKNIVKKVHIQLHRTLIEFYSRIV